MQDLLKLLTNPIYILAALAGLTLLFRRYKKPRSFRGTLFVTIIFGLIVSSNPLPAHLVNELERKYQAFEPKNHEITKKETHILVLGGGYIDDPSIPPNSRLSSNSLARVVEGIRLHRLLPGSKLIFSGKAKRDEVSIAETMLETAMALGVKKERTAVMTKPSTTAKEAAYYKEHFFSDSSQLIISTSAIHMPRAMLTFEKRQLSPIPAPTNHTAKNHRNLSKDSWWGFSAGNMRKLEKALREILAIEYEKMTE